MPVVADQLFLLCQNGSQQYVLNVFIFDTTNRNIYNYKKKIVDATEIEK